VQWCRDFAILLLLTQYEQLLAQLSVLWHHIICDPSLLPVERAPAAVNVFEGSAHDTLLATACCYVR
jgi:hypothetical protein